MINLVVVFPKMTTGEQCLASRSFSRRRRKGISITWTILKARARRLRPPDPTPLPRSYVPLAGGVGAGCSESKHIPPPVKSPSPRHPAAESQGFTQTLSGEETCLRCSAAASFLPPHHWSFLFPTPAGTGAPGTVPGA